MKFIPGLLHMETSWTAWESVMLAEGPVSYGSLYGTLRWAAVMLPFLPLAVPVLSSVGLCKLWGFGKLAQRPQQFLLQRWSLSHTVSAHRTFIIILQSILNLIMFFGAVKFLILQFSATRTPQQHPRWPELTVEQNKERDKTAGAEEASASLPFLKIRLNI